MTAQPLFDGTFSIDAVAATAHAVVARLHDEAMATIATLADTWDQPVEDAAPVQVDEPVTYREPATWSVTDEEDELLDDDDDEVLPVLELPPLVLRPRPTATNVTARLGAAQAAGADAVTDEFAAPPEGRRQLAAI
ncbi:hypothetical protein [Modestobacter altitudinis]|uniref:hypothetical protein n=1 Tax=Modestobacter altitudinis TaxID=2213158 RepID=UPI00110D0D5D|nr:hypothetical protein [Modestobacter altitudinis]